MYSGETAYPVIAVNGACGIAITDHSIVSSSDEATYVITTCYRSRCITLFDLTISIYVSNDTTDS